MRNFDRKLWHATKQAQRIIRYRHRMEQATAENTAPWLDAVDRDDLAFPLELPDPMDQDAINESFLKDDPLVGALSDHFFLQVDAWTPTNRIVEELAAKGYHVTTQALAAAAQKLGLKRVRQPTAGPSRPWGYRGIQQK